MSRTRAKVAKLREVNGRDGVVRREPFEKAIKPLIDKATYLTVQCSLCGEEEFEQAVLEEMTEDELRARLTKNLKKAGWRVVHLESSKRFEPVCKYCYENNLEYM